MATVVPRGYVKTFLNHQTTVDDDVLDSVIAQAEEKVALNCGPLVPTTLTKRVRVHGGRLVLPVRPVISVTSATGVDSGVALTLTADRVNTAAGYIIVDGAQHGVAYDIVYQAGYSTLPEGLKRSVAERSRYLFRPLQGPRLTQQQIDDSMAALRMAESLEAPYRMYGMA